RHAGRPDPFPKLRQVFEPSGILVTPSVRPIEAWDACSVGMLCCPGWHAVLSQKDLRESRQPANGRHLPNAPRTPDKRKLREYRIKKKKARRRRVSVATRR